MNKRCCTCKKEKPIAEFGILIASKDGHARRCKPCARYAVAATKRIHGHGKVDPVKAEERSKRFYERNPDYGKRQFAKHREKINARSLAYQKVHRIELRTKGKFKYAAKAAARRAAFIGPHIPPHIWRRRQAQLWHEAHPWQKQADTALRRARKKHATPAWANSFFIREAYHLAKLRTKATGFKWEVDHIYPLQSDLVCGLHVEHNLQVVPAVLNRSKGNKVLHHG